MFSLKTYIDSPHTVSSLLERKSLFYVLSLRQLPCITVIIGGRGVGNWEGDQPNFGRGVGVVFGRPGGGNKFPLSEKGKGGNKRKPGKFS